MNVFVAIGASCRQRFVHVKAVNSRLLVANLAIQTKVTASDWEIGGGVFECDFLPTFNLMATLATIDIPSGHQVFAMGVFVAIVAGFGIQAEMGGWWVEFRWTGLEVTGDAGDGEVGTLESEVGSGMALNVEGRGEEPFH